MTQEVLFYMDQWEDRKIDTPELMKRLKLKKLPKNKQQGFNEYEGWKEIQEWYARLILGRKILACVEATGSCSFEAEC